MALSPAQRHTAMIEAQRKLDNQQALAGSVSMHLQKMAISHDAERLRGLTRVEKTRLKSQELLPRWMPTVEQYLSDGEVYSNPVFAYCIVWLFDIGDFDRALAWADIAIEQKQLTPFGLRRGFAPFVADTILAWAEQSVLEGQSIEPYFSQVFEKVRDQWQLYEQISAKWFKFAGLRLISNDKGEPLPSAIKDVASLQEADALLASAHRFHFGCGVRTYRQKIAARLRALEKE
ncbi:phage terminase small subunit [Yersinia ruckeri]|uniref:phage terminase small subunit n=1 Tax=Yersinia TaxID=629 RepID=UPI000EAB5DA1|nr:MULTISPECIES: phage terminase small subunit [Yersinia]UZX55819.1 phage terminase small subunit [Yersinia ruckeri]